MAKLRAKKTHSSRGPSNIKGPPATPLVSDCYYYSCSVLLLLLCVCKFWEVVRVTQRFLSQKKIHYFISTSSLQIPCKKVKNTTVLLECLCSVTTQLHQTTHECYVLQSTHTYEDIVWKRNFDSCCSSYDKRSKARRMSMSFERGGRWTTTCGVVFE